MSQEFKFDRKIFKYPLVLTNTQSVSMMKGADILCVKTQYNELVLYAEVSANEIYEEFVEIIIAGTGHPLPNLNMQYIGTCMTSQDTLVWHVYKIVK